MAKLSKQDRINAEIKRLTELFSDLDTKAMASIDSLIRRAAWMRITLEDYEADIDLKGSVELFTQSDKTEPYERERPVARLYNTMNKNYQSITKQLVESLPKAVPHEVSDEILEFVSGAR